MEDKKHADIIDGVRLVDGETVIAEENFDGGVHTVIYYGNHVEMNGKRVQNKLAEDKYEYVLQRYIESKAENARQPERQEQKPENKQEQQPVPKAAAHPDQGGDKKPQENTKESHTGNAAEKGSERRYSENRRLKNRNPADKAPKKRMPDQIPEPDLEKTMELSAVTDERIAQAAVETAPAEPEKTEKEEESKKENPDTAPLPQIEEKEESIESEQNVPASDEPEERKIPESVYKTLREADDSSEPSKLRKMSRRMMIERVISVSAIAVLLAVNIAPRFLSEEMEQQVSVIQITDTIPAGKQITSDNLKETYITADEFRSLAQSVLNGDGNIDQAQVVLYSNVDDVIGTYANETLNTGDYLHESDYSSVVSGEKMITMSVDGEEVVVPVTIAKSGETTISLYAICTSQTDDGKTSNVALKLSDLSLEGKSLMDILDADGNSVIDQLIKEQEENKKEAEAEAEKTSAPEETAAPTDQAE